MYRVTVFELDRSLLERDIWPGPRDILTRVNEFAFSVDELATTLVQAGASIDMLDVPWKCNYPI